MLRGRILIWNYLTWLPRKQTASEYVTKGTGALSDL